MSQYRGMPRPGRESGWVGEQGEWGGDRRVLEGKPGKGIGEKRGGGEGERERGTSQCV